MAEIVGILAVGFAFGLLVGGGLGYDKGFRAGTSWAMTNIFGREP